ncbi:MAG TPA: alpha/beta hydrolase [Candidatus Sulfotelmatobacter sp.]|nr:alpha/beta hydrolase [Candidatus Sulfotelmatobacter sp.]
MQGSIDYDEQGSGPTILLVPGSCSTGAAWRPVIAALGDRFRTVTTSLPGCGGTIENRSSGHCSIADVADVLEAVIRRAGARVHLVGHSFGGLAALAAARRAHLPVASLTVLEAPAAEALRTAGEPEHYRAFRDMTDAYFAAFAAGDQEAVAGMIDFYGGPGTFAAWPQKVRGYAIATTAANILDWACAYGFALSPSSLVGVKLPTLIAWGEASHPAAQRANQVLASYLAGASTATISGATHFMIATHAKEVAAIIADHVGRAG